MHIAHILITNSKINLNEERDGQAPLDVAISKQQAMTVDLLLSHGCKIKPNTVSLNHIVNFLEDRSPDVNLLNTISIVDQQIKEMKNEKLIALYIPRLSSIVQKSQGKMSLMYDELTNEICASTPFSKSVSGIIAEYSLFGFKPNVSSASKDSGACLVM